MRFGSCSLFSVHTVEIQLPSVDTNSAPKSLTIDLEVFSLREMLGS